MRKIEPSEYDICASCVRWFKLAFPESLLIKIPNEGRRHPRAASDMGILKGVPDYFIPHSNSQFCGLFIEMKKPGGKLTSEQGDIQVKLLRKGYLVEVGQSLDDFMNIVKSYFSS